MILFAAFPKWEMPDPAREVWDTILAVDATPGMLLAGALHLSRTSKFPPTIASWREAAIACDPRRAYRPTAAEAWDEMYRARHRIDRSKPVRWSCSAVERAAQSVQWENPDWLTEQIPTIRAQFERYYTALADKGEEIAEVQKVLDLAMPAQSRLGQ
jgi:hypothetical protein